ncbi:MAG: hypothetical protein HN685_04015, partial [Waddliaceae bacterium]|nr:hypothetical protein [Waddliaceae bacterium]
MFEFSVAYKYLIPRRRQLSVSIITIISTLVISVVVWLILVFFSVTTGLEKGWVEKLVALTAPIRLTPTEEYYQSYYYNVDSISDASDYSTKTIGEKLSAESTDPYDPGIDMEIPPYWRSPDTNASGTTKDLVKDTFSLLQSQGLTAGDYDHALAQMRLRLVRHSNEGMGSTTQTFLTQGCYLSSFDAKNHSVATITLEPTASDLANIFALLATSADAATEDMPSSDDSVSSETFHEKLDAFLENTTITHLKTPPEGWYIPPSMLKTPKLSAFALVDGDTMIKASLDEKSIPSAESPEDLIFNIEIDIKGVTLSGSTPYGELTIGAATTT